MTSNAIAIVAGLFLMIGSIVLVLGTVVFLLDGTHPLLLPALSIAGLVVSLTTIIGLFDKRVFKHAVTWLGMW